jgi:hypothetical protein
MNEPDVEDLLRRYRPVGPPPELRGRVVAPVPPVRRAWPWAAAAAALLASVCVLQVSTRNIYQSVGHAVGGGEVVNLDEFPALRAAIADDELLERLVEASQAIERLEPAPPSPALEFR